jgi:nucleotide-binding universal stress UspA family protein
VASAETTRQIALKKILYLTDFSESAAAAVPFVAAIARNSGSTVYAAHVLLPDVYACMAPEFGDLVKDGLEQAAKAKMQRIEPQLAGLPHETVVVWGEGIWPALWPVMQKNNIDLVVLGTHGRAGVQKLLLGSVAEEIWRRSTVPVLTVGPAIRGAQPDGRFHCVLWATDFTPESLAGCPYALSMANENHARLILLHVIRQFKKEQILGKLSAIEAIHQLNGMLPQDVELWCIPELVVKHGEPAEQIIEVARESGADLIVLGIRKGDNFGVATHARRTTAHDEVVNAPCPVLTIRG